MTPAEMSPRDDHSSTVFWREVCPIERYPLFERVEEGMMAELIRTAQYFKMQIADTPGALAGMLAPLRDAGVNLMAVHAFPRNRRTQVDVVPEDPIIFKNVVKVHQLKMQGPKTCL